MNRIVEKITVCLVIFMLLFSNMGIVLNYGITYAANIINNSNNQAIKFDSYFQNNMHEAITNTDSNDLKLYISISIENGGYLKNGVISFINENFDIVTDNFENEIIEKIENNVITLKQINDGTNVLLELPIKMKDPDYINPDIFSKEFETKLDGIYVNGLAEEIQISQSVKNKLSWHGETKSSTELSIQKYIPFNNKENYGVLLQIKANTKVEENKLPVNIMNLNIEVPIINEQKPNKVKVIANRTTGTNGISDGLSFNEENWNYDLESGIVNINVVNTLNENNEVAWIKNADDEYLISFIYEGKDIYDFVNENGFDSSVKVITNISVYNDVETKLEENAINGNISLDYKVSDIVSFNLICKENEINKGQIYSNYEAENKSEIEYNLQYIADIGYADLIDYIEFSQNDYDKFVTEDNKIALTTINEKNYTRNKQISINENIFNKILGENGYVYIYDKDKINEIEQIVETVRERERESYSRER